MSKLKIIISGINIQNGGALSIYKECLHELENASQYDVIALVHDKSLFNDFKNIRFIELARAKRNYFYRLFYEYFYFYFLSLRLTPDLWLSLHDMTPNVKAPYRAVYCHNPAPFYQMSKLEKQLDRKMWLFNKFYSWVYRINIHKNSNLIVQQNWLADEFSSRYQVPLAKIIVANPQGLKVSVDRKMMKSSSEKKIFFYPSFPRSFKNFEVICSAAEILIQQGISDFEVILTIDGNENPYSKHIVDRFKKLSCIKFIGLISRDKVLEYYEESSCLIFPSKIETWGLPISEYKSYAKPILVADLPYAVETIGDYSNVAYFPVNDSKILAQLMLKIINGEVFSESRKKRENKYTTVTSWLALISVLLGQK